MLNPRTHTGNTSLRIGQTQTLDKAGLEIVKLLEFLLHFTTLFFKALLQFYTFLFPTCSALASPKRSNLSKCSPGVIKLDSYYFYILKLKSFLKGHTFTQAKVIIILKGHTYTQR
jgi:hypothetical protein